MKGGGLLPQADGSFASFLDIRTKKRSPVNLKVTKIFYHLIDI